MIFHQNTSLDFFIKTANKVNELNEYHLKQDISFDQENSLVIDVSPSPLGDIYYIADSNFLYLLDFLDKDLLETELTHFQKRLPIPFICEENTITSWAKKEIRDYFEFRLQEFTVPVRLLGTPFQLQVWETLRKIPYGSTWSYSEQATYMQRPKAVRAVARTNGLNRLTIIYPCHRVIGKNGHLTGYAGSLERKAWLLEHEKK